MEEKQGMKDINELFFQMKKILEENMSAFMEAYRLVNLEYDKKGLNKNNIHMLVNGQIEVSMLSEYDLIAFCKAFTELGFSGFNANNFFGSMKLVSYEHYEKIEGIPDKIELKNFIKKNNFEYRGQITYKQIYDYLNYTLLFYDKEAQRSPKFKKIGAKNNGTVTMSVRTENLNMKSVKNIAKVIIDKKFEDTELVLNCEILEGKKQNFKFISANEKLAEIFANRFKINKREAKNILDEETNDVLGDIIIKPNYVMTDSDTTWVSITDGFHRCKGIVKAVSDHLEKTGEYLEGSIGVRLVRVDKERAKRIVHQTFLRSTDEPEWTKSLNDDDYSKFVDTVVELSKNLTIDNTIDLAQMNNKLTSKSLLIDLVKKMNIEVNDDSEAYTKSKKIAKDFDLIYSIAKNEGVEFNPYKVAQYFYFAFIFNTHMDIEYIIQKMENSNKLNSMYRKNMSINKFIETINEVIKSE